MSGIGDRLREERERLGLSQGAFGDIGGVKANAQGNYEKGDRFPDAAYLAAVAEHGVDVLYVVTGERRPLYANQLSSSAAEFVGLIKTMDPSEVEVLRRTAQAFSRIRR